MPITIVSIMEISNLLNMLNPQGGVPIAGAVATGFDHVIAQVLATGGPEPPVDPPGDTDPWGEKLTTLEPNAQSIQPDSAADLETLVTNLGLAAVALTPEVPIAAFESIQPEVTVAIPSVPSALTGQPLDMPSILSGAASAPPVSNGQPLEIQAPFVAIKGEPVAEPVPIAEQVALTQLLQSPELGITRITINGLSTPSARPVAESHVVENPAILEAIGAHVPNKMDPMKPRPTLEQVAEPAGKEVIQAEVKPENVTERPVITPKEARIEPVIQAPQAEGESPVESGESNRSNLGGQDSRDPQSNQDPRQDAAIQVNPVQARPVEAKAPIADRPVTIHPLVRDLADRIEMMAATRSQESVTIEFRPLDLGDIKVMLIQSEDRVEATVITDNDRVRQAVHAMQPELRAMLDQRGVQLGAFNVMDFGQPKEQAPQNPQHQPSSTPFGQRETAASAPSALASSSAVGVDLSI